MLVKKINNKIWPFVKDFFYQQRVADTPLIRNINFSCNGYQKRVLVLYLSDIYFRDFDMTKSGRTVPYEIFKIINVFSQFGYCIDLASHNDIKAIQMLSKKDYDMVFGFGDAFYEFAELRPEVLSVLYMTEHHPDFSFREEQKRADYFYERHGRRVPLERSGRFYKKEHMGHKYDSVITLGEVKPFAKQYKNPYNIYPSGFISRDFEFPVKDFEKARKNFLWLGSDAVIHKGLDLLIDIFSLRDDIFLHICGLNEKSRKLLGIPKRENLLDYGFINVQSPEFQDIIGKCAFSVLPSCSVGFATSITTSMLYGMIPVVNKDTGFNRLNDLAFFFDDYHVESMAKVLNDLADKNPSDLISLSENVKDFASANFTLDAFESRFREIIGDITENPEIVSGKNI
jgi:hypothetical protein